MNYYPFYVFVETSLPEFNHFFQSVVIGPTHES